jgi:hypothetical protein
MFRLFEEQLFPLNKSNSKYLRVGFTPHDQFKVKFILWDIATNKQILLEMHDIINIQLLIMTDTIKDGVLDLSTSTVFYNTNRANLIHIKEHITQKTLTFHEETLKNLVQSKHIYQFPMMRHDMVLKGDNIVKIISELTRGITIDENSLRTYFDTIHDKMVIKDKKFLGELLYKFSSTLLTILNYY